LPTVEETKSLADSFILNFSLDQVSMSINERGDGSGSHFCKTTTLLWGVLLAFTTQMRIA